ncbi:hypothetical protein SAMN05216499_109194 [Actinacidiphila paucisporea]|uniref:Uncharacterized protein n=1 Tax=Actinacidiphila paucisporea TaxID=310782 RepID=A0A1M7H8Y9_9ACTN|nr:hypothetical protein SAMN05216499_109194 [Actinacidiphila paucisporea]
MAIHHIAGPVIIQGGGPLAGWGFGIVIVVVAVVWGIVYNVRRK